MKDFEVISDRDGGVVISASTVRWEATVRRVSPRVTAQRIAKQNGDAAMGETLSIREVQ